MVWGEVMTERSTVGANPVMRSLSTSALDAKGVKLTNLVAFHLKHSCGGRTLSACNSGVLLHGSALQSHARHC